MAYYSKVGDYTPGTRARGLEIETEFDTIVTGFANVEAVVDADGALGKDLTGGAAYQLTGMVDAVNPQDYATLANVTSEVAGGGTPGNIPITSLGVGTATANQFIVINSGGTAPEGQTGTTAAALIPITSLGVGTGTSDQAIKLNSAGTAIEGATLANTKNFLLNGSMDVAQQRFTAATVTYTSATDPANSDDTYLLDGWYLLSDGNDAYDISQSTAALPDGASNAWLFDVETISKKGGMLQIIEAKETARLFKGGNGTCSLSFKAIRTGSAMEIKAAVLAWDSTADTVTSDVVSAWGVDGTTPTFATNWTAENTPADLGVSTSWQTFKIENISLDTASTTNLAVFIWVDTTTSNAGEFVYITDVQLEDGEQATPIARVPVALERLRCQRFLVQYTKVSGTIDLPVTGICDTNNDIVGTYTMPIEMRAAPTMSVSNQTHFRAWGASLETFTSFTLIRSSTTNVLVDGVVAGTPFTAGHSMYINSSTSNAYWRLSAIL